MSRNVVIKNLAEVAAARAARPAVFRPEKVGDRWRMPRWSAMAIAREKKRVLISGGTWKWDIPPKVVEKRMPFKGHKRDARKVERAAEIARCMARMPRLVEEYRKGRPRKKRGGLAELLLEPLPMGTDAGKGKGKGKGR